MNKCCICLAVMNVDIFIPKIIKNAQLIGKVFDECKIIFFYDNSHDGTLPLIREYQQKYDNIHVIINDSPLDKERTKTHHLALARNGLVNYVRKNHGGYEFFIMMDADEICTHVPDINVLKKYLYRSDWDCLTFNKEHYYDLWALSMKELPFSCWHFDHPRGYNAYNKLITDKLKNVAPGELIDVLSAFNGFGIYRTKKFEGAVYDGYARRDLIPEYMMANNIKVCGEVQNFYWDPWVEGQDCEHRSFHMYASIMNDAKICICPEILFPTDPDFDM